MILFSFRLNSGCEDLGDLGRGEEQWGSPSGILPQILFFDSNYFCDSLAVTWIAFRCRKPNINDLGNLFRREHLSAKRENIGVIVLSAVTGRSRIITHRGANARNFISCHARTDAGAVNHDAQIALAVGYGLGDGVSEIRVINSLLRKRAEVTMTIAELVEMFFEPLLHLVPAVIGADGDEAMKARGGTSRAVADFDASLTDQIPRGWSDNCVFTNQQRRAGRNSAHIG